MCGRGFKGSFLRQWNSSYDSRSPYDFHRGRTAVEAGKTFQHEEQGVKIEKQERTLHVQRLASSSDWCLGNCSWRGCWWRDLNARERS